MAQSTRPTPDNGRVIGDDEYELLAAGYGADGLIGTPADTTPVYADSTGLQVKIRAGKQALIRGRLWRSDPSAAEVLGSLPANTSGLSRIDRAVLRLDKSTWNATVVHLQGTAAGSPVAPALTQSLTSSGFYDLPLARWTVANNYTTVAAADVTNEAWYLNPAGDIACTSTSRPQGATLKVGTAITESDTGLRYAWSGTAWLPAGGSGALIETKVLTVAAATVTFTAIPATYRNLQLFVMAKSSSTVDETVDVDLWCNNDTATNYSWLNLKSDHGEGWVIESQTAQTFLRLMKIPTTHVSVNTAAFGGGEALVLGYSSTLSAAKQVQATSSSFGRNAEGEFRLRSGAWCPATIAAVNRLDLTCDVGNFVIGSVFQLYGVG